MMQNPSLLTRVAVGKVLGLVLSVAGLLIFQGMLPELGLRFNIALVLWFVTIGAFVGLMGVFSVYPMLNVPLPWWFRGAWIGGWMNLLLVLLAYDQLSATMTETFGAGSVLDSPWWIVLDGMCFGLAADWLCTRLGGEGVKCVSKEALLQD